MTERLQNGEAEQLTIRYGQGGPGGDRCEVISETLIVGKMGW